MQETERITVIYAELIHEYLSRLESLANEFTGARQQVCHDLFELLKTPAEELTPLQLHLGWYLAENIWSRNIEDCVFQQCLQVKLEKTLAPVKYLAPLISYAQYCNFVLSLRDQYFKFPAVHIQETGAVFLELTRCRALNVEKEISDFSRDCNR
jgi:hypothetical protein